MNYKQLLTHLKLEENKDYVLTESSFEMLEQTRLIQVDFDLVEEKFTLERPSEEVLANAELELQLLQCDLASLIEEYLANKQELKDEDDCLNIVDGLLWGWSFKNIPRPSNSELVALISASEAKKNQKQINEAALKYLAETDWYVLRSIDGEACPEDIKALRQAARTSIVR